MNSRAIRNFSHITESLAALSLITSFIAVAGQAFDEHAIPQPLTRADCDAASGWSWSETANVCKLSPQPAVTFRSQPLTRADCDLVRMSWNESALDCEEKSEGSAQRCKVASSAKSRARHGQATPRSFKPGYHAEFDDFQPRRRPEATRPRHARS
jgi:hypothetical protein